MRILGERGRQIKHETIRGSSQEAALWLGRLKEPSIEFHRRLVDQQARCKNQVRALLRCMFSMLRSGEAWREAA